MRLVEVYQTTKLGAMCPAYCDDQAYPVDKGLFLIVVNPDHVLVQDMRKRGTTVLSDLKRRKFRSPQFVWTGFIGEDIFDSRIFEEVSWCPGCGRLHSDAHEDAFKHFAELSAEDAISAMLGKFGVLGKTPRRSGGR